MNDKTCVYVNTFELEATNSHLNQTGLTVIPDEYFEPGEQVIIISPKTGDYLQTEVKLATLRFKVRSKLEKIYKKQGLKKGDSILLDEIRQGDQRILLLSTRRNPPGYWKEIKARIKASKKESKPVLTKQKLEQIANSIIHETNNRKYPRRNLSPTRLCKKGR